MGALPNTLPTTPRKSPSKASKSTKLNQYGRDPGSASEKMRVSDYDHPDFAPFAPVPMSFFSDLPRLTSGKSDTWLILAAWAKSAGRGVAPKHIPKKMKDLWEGVEPGKRPEWTLSLDLSEWANLARCSERQVEREFSNLQSEGREMIEVEKTGPGKYRIRVLFRNWEALPDYAAPVVEIKPADEDEKDELTEEEEAKPGNQRVTGKKPMRLAAGQSSKRFPVNTGVKEFQARVEGPVDCEISAVIQAGRFVTVVRFPDDWLKKAQNQKTASNDSNELAGIFRRGRRKTESRVEHPRAGELVALFDEFLAKSASVLLSMDSVALEKACEAVGDCDHDFLVKFAVNRGAAPIKKPGHVALICAEALQSWKASKVLKSAGAVSREEIDAMVQRDLAELARKRKELAESRRRPK